MQKPKRSRLHLLSRFIFKTGPNADGQIGLSRAHPFDVPACNFNLSLLFKIDEKRDLPSAALILISVLEGCFLTFFDSKPSKAETFHAKSFSSVHDFSGGGRDCQLPLRDVAGQKR